MKLILTLTKYIHITTVYYICPVLVLYVPFSYKWIAGITLGPLIIIKLEVIDDKGLYYHELTHARQWWRLPVIHWLLRLNKKYRYACVIEAHRAQLAYSSSPTALAARFAEAIPGDYKFPDKKVEEVFNNLVGKE